MVHEELATPAEQLGQHAAPVDRVEFVVLVDAHPRQRASLPTQLVASTRQLLLRREELETRAEPFVAIGDRVIDTHG